MKYELRPLNAFKENKDNNIKDNNSNEEISNSNSLKAIVIVKGKVRSISSKSRLNSKSRWGGGVA